MDTEKVRELVEKVKQNRTKHSPMEEGIAKVASQQILERVEASQEDDATNSMDEHTIDELLESRTSDAVHDPTNNELINTLITNVSRLNLNGKNASILLTLIYLLKMDSTKFQSQQEITEALGHKSVSTIERHLKHLRDNGMLATEIIADGYGSKAVYKFGGLIEKLELLA